MGLLARRAKISSREVPRSLSQEFKVCSATVWALGSKPRQEPERSVTFTAVNGRPFDTIAAAEAAWQADDLNRAEELFRQGIDGYKSHEPDGVDFALGRYGAFLLDQDRKDEALRVLEQAIEQKTDIPAIWSDYVRIVSDRRDLGALKRGIELMASAMKRRVDAAVGDLGRILERAGRVDDAVKLWQDAFDEQRSR